MPIDPVTLSALIEGGSGLLGGLFGGGEGKANRKLQAREGEKDRALTRDEMLMELLLLASETDFQNRVAQRNSEIIARELGEHARLFGGQASPMTIARANAGARAPEGAFGENDADMRQLIHSNFQDFQAAKQRAQQSAAAITPESLFVGKNDPLEAIRSKAPGLLDELSNINTNRATGVRFDHPSRNKAATPGEIRRALSRG